MYQYFLLIDNKFVEVSKDDFFDYILHHHLNYWFYEFNNLYFTFYSNWVNDKWVCFCYSIHYGKRI